jgi:hypothetical protein
LEEVEVGGRAGRLGLEEVAVGGVRRCEQEGGGRAGRLGLEEVAVGGVRRCEQEGVRRPRSPDAVGGPVTPGFPSMQ